MPEVDGRMLEQARKTGACISVGLADSDPKELVMVVVVSGAKNVNAFQRLLRQHDILTNLDKLPPVVLDRVQGRDQ